MVKQDVKELLTKEFFGESKSKREIERIKIALVRRTIEYNSLKSLFMLYKKCLQEFLTIKHEIEI